MVTSVSPTSVSPMGVSSPPALSGGDRTIAVRVAPEHLATAWPDLWPMLSPAALAGNDTADSVFAAIAAGDAQLWAVVDGGRPIAAVVTQITLGPPKRCRLWLVGARRDASRLAVTVCDWAVDLVAALEPFARSFGCVALWGSGRIGWHRIARKFGGTSIGIVAGLPSWERRI